MLPGSTAVIRVTMLHHERATRGELHGRLDAGGGEPVEHGGEPTELPVDVRGIGARRYVKVRAHAAEPEPRQLGDGRDHLHRLLGRQPRRSSPASTLTNTSKGSRALSE